MVRHLAPDPDVSHVPLQGDPMVSDSLKNMRRYSSNISHKHNTDDPTEPTNMFLVLLVGADPRWINLVVPLL